MSIERPKFQINDQVWYKVTITDKASNITVSRWFEFTVVSAHRAATGDRLIFTYDLSNDPCGPYYGGRVNFMNVYENELFENEPMIDYSCS